MEDVFRVALIDAVNRDMGAYLIAGAVNPGASKALATTQKKLIKQTAKSIEVLLASLNVPVHALYTPHAADYVDYYSKPNFGEAYVAKL